MSETISVNTIDFDTILHSKIESGESEYELYDGTSSGFSEEDEINTDAEEGPEISEEIEHVIDNNPPKKHRSLISSCLNRPLKTGLYFYCYLCVGFLNAVMGPMLTRMRTQIGVNESQISWVISARGVGLVIGTLFSGYTYNRFKKSESDKLKWYTMTIDRVLAMYMFIMTISLLFVPYINSYFMILLMHLFQGWSSGGVEVGANLAIGWTWEKNFRPFLNGLHLSSALGSLLFPLLITQIFTYFTETYQMTITYLSCSSMAFSVIIPLLLISPPRISESEKRMSKKKFNFKKEPKKYACEQLQNFFSYPTLINSLAAIVKGTSTGAYSVFGSIIFQYAKKKEIGNDVQLAYLTTCFWGCFALGRFLSIFQSIYQSPFAMLITSVGGTVCSYVVFISFPDHYFAIWIGSILHGLLSSSISPSAVALPSNFDIPFNAISTSVIVLGSTLGEMIIAMIVNLLLPYGENTFLYSLGSTYAICFCVILLIFAIGKGKPLFCKNDNPTPSPTPTS